MGWDGYWKPYVPVHKRREQAARYATTLAKKEKRTLCPVQIKCRGMATTFWGKAWCDNLERYGDFANRLPRGRTYARNGSVVDLQIGRGRVTAIVGGSDVYEIDIQIDTLTKSVWKKIKTDCSHSIDSLMDLLQGQFEQGVMARLTRQHDGLFPDPKQIKMSCTCPDWAVVCKHVAAALYGVAARLDSSPELLFTLRAVDHLELIEHAVAAENLEDALGTGSSGALADADLSELFGIELDSTDAAKTPIGKRRRAKPVSATAARKPAEKVSKKSRRKSPSRQPKMATRTTSKSSKVGVTGQAGNAKSARKRRKAIVDANRK